jgi:hypothetical protein
MDLYIYFISEINIQVFFPVWVFIFIFVQQIGLLYQNKLVYFDYFVQALIWSDRCSIHSGMAYQSNSDTL